jgi:hypothetical protein
MIDYTLYINKPIVLTSKYFSEITELPNLNLSIYKFKNKYVCVKILTKSDAEDEDFVDWLNTIWKHTEKNIKQFLRHAKKIK